MPAENFNRIIKVIIYCAIIIFVLLLLYLFLGRPAAGYSKRLRLELKSRELKLQESERLIRSLPNPQAAITEMEKKVQEFKDMGVSRKQLPKLIQLLGRLSTERNINVISIRPREDMRPASESLPTGISKVYVEMIFNGSYKTIGEFLKALNEIPTFFSIESMLLEKEEDIGQPPSEPKKPGEKPEVKSSQLTATLILSTYMVWEL